MILRDARQLLENWILNRFRRIELLFYFFQSFEDIDKKNNSPKLLSSDLWADLLSWAGTNFQKRKCVINKTKRKLLRSAKKEKKLFNNILRKEKFRPFPFLTQLFDSKRVYWRKNNSSTFKYIIAGYTLQPFKIWRGKRHGFPNFIRCEAGLT